VLKVINDLHTIKKPNSLYLPAPVEGGQMQGNAFVEKTCAKMGASMFGYGSHTKKRPDHLVLGRLFSGQVLDTFQFRVLSAGPPLGATRRLPQLGSMTAFVFLGKFWQSDRYLTQFKNYLIDSFGIRHSKTLLVDSVETVLVSTAHNATHVTLKQYLMTKKGAPTSKHEDATNSTTHSGGKSAAKFELTESLPDIALEMVTGQVCEGERMRDALGLKGKAKTPHGLKQLEKKRERKFKVQEKRSEKILSASDVQGGVGWCADLCVRPCSGTFV